MKVTPSVTDTCVETTERLERSTVGQGVGDTLDANLDINPKVAGHEKKKSKKRKHKKVANDGESSEPKKKLCKEERAAKKARKVERRARRGAQEAAETDVAEDVIPEEAEESVPEEVIPPVTKLSGDDKWLPDHEPQGEDAQEDVQDSDTEDVAVVMNRKRKSKRKLKLN
ncbi:hypothetical protein LIER_29857 [Lithospermum erythrorhizon]|uniref:Uncharacterized protein n=1 Tax=Lithospermum erythrorhizon TaxID=34254 RepID=A0AAV3RQT4_LITER